MSKPTWDGPFFPVKKHLAERYAQALKHACNLECPLTEFSIDRLGWSPQLAALLGEHYLGAEALRYAIILSPDQSSAPPISRRFSYEVALVDRVYEEARATLHQMIDREPVIVELDNGMTFCRSAADVLGITGASATIETPQNTLSKSRTLLGLAEGLGERARLLDDSYIDQMLTLVKDVGDIRKLPLPPELKMALGSLWAEVDGVVYLLRPPAGSQAEPIVIATRPDSALGRLPLTAIELDDPRLVDLLHVGGYLRYGNEGALLGKRIGELELDALLAADEDAAPADSPACRRQLARSPAAQGLLPPLYWELDAEQKRLSAGGSFDAQQLSVEARWALSTPGRDNEIIINLLSRFVRYDYRLLVHHQRRSVQAAWGRYTEARRRYMQGVFPYITEGFTQ